MAAENTDYRCCNQIHEPYQYESRQCFHIVLSVEEHVEGNVCHPLRTLYHVFELCYRLMWIPGSCSGQCCLQVKHESISVASRLVVCEISLNLMRSDRTAVLLLLRTGAGRTFKHKKKRETAWSDPFPAQIGTAPRIVKVLSYIVRVLHSVGEVESCPKAETKISRLLILNKASR